MAANAASMNRTRSVSTAPTTLAKPRLLARTAWASRLASPRSQASSEASRRVSRWDGRRRQPLGCPQGDEQLTFALPQTAWRSRLRKVRPAPAEISDGLVKRQTLHGFLAGRRQLLDEPRIA